MKEKCAIDEISVFSGTFSKRWTEAFREFSPEKIKNNGKKYDT